MKDHLRRVFPLLLAGGILLGSCENDIERVGLLTDETLIPKIKGNQIEVIYSDSARVKVRITAPLFMNFPDLERPYMEFPKGMDVFFYGDSLKLESSIRADYTIYYTKERLWHATGNVIARRLSNGDELNTEEMYWDEQKEFIYSNAYTRVQNEDGTFYGKEGFTSDQHLNNWQLIGTSGTVTVPDEE